MAAPLQAFLEEIDNTIAYSTRERRAAMLRHLTDFFVVGADEYSDEEIALIDEVFVKLIGAIEESSRALLSIRLGPLTKAPSNVLRILACDNAIEIASPILIQSQQLDEPTLVECAKTKSQEHLLAISRRKTLGERVTDILVARGDQQVMYSTAKNSGAMFSKNGFTILVDRSLGDDRLAMCVGRRHDIPSDVFRRLLENASEFVRTKLESENPSAARDIRSAVTGVANKIATEADVKKTTHAIAKVLVDTLQQTGQLTTAKVDEFATAGKFDEVSFSLAALADMPVEFVERSILDPSCEPLLVLSKAIGLCWETTRTILSLCARRSGQPEAEIDQLGTAFERLKGATAQQIVAFRRAAVASASMRALVKNPTAKSLPN